MKNPPLALHLYLLQGMSVNQIADKEGVSNTRVKSWIAKLGPEAVAMARENGKQRRKRGKRFNQPCKIYDSD